MKKVMLIAFGTGLFMISCGSKEAQISSEKKDSMTVTADTITSKDSITMQSPETIKTPVDTATVPVK